MAMSEILAASIRGVPMADPMLDAIAAKCVGQTHASRRQMKDGSEWAQITFRASIRADGCQNPKAASREADRLCREAMAALRADGHTVARQLYSKKPNGGRYAVRLCCPGSEWSALAPIESAMAECLVKL